MSGEIVLIPLPTPEVILATLVVAVVSEVFRAREAALDAKAERQKRHLDRWQNFRDREQKLIVALQNSREMTQNVQADLALLGLQEPQAPVAEYAQPSAKGFVIAAADNPNQHQIVAELNVIAQRLDKLPVSLLQDKSTPFMRLKKQCQDLLDEQNASHEQVQSFADLVQRTLAAYHQDLEDKCQYRERLLENVERLLDKVIKLAYMTDAPAEQQELQSLQEHLLTKLASTEVTAGALDVMSKRLEQLTAVIDGRMRERALQETLATKLNQHLQALGYTCLQDFSVNDSNHYGIFGIPGGEQVKVIIHQDRRVAFQMLHERMQYEEQLMSGDETEFFRHQEERWCSDSESLLRELTKEGFLYKIQFERDAPQESIPIVVVENVDDILEDDEEEASRFSAKDQKRLSL